MGNLFSCFTSPQHTQDMYSCRKVLILGDPTVGKTCLANRWVNADFCVPTTNTSGDYVITTNPDHFVKDITVYKSGKNISMCLTIYDTSGHDEYVKYRQNVYPRTDGILVCFSVDDRASFENVKEHWLPEVTRQISGVPILLVGTKSDLRNREPAVTAQYDNIYEDLFVTKSEAEKLISDTSLGVGYMECSSFTGMGVNEVFQRIGTETARRKSQLQRSKNRFKFS